MASPTDNTMIGQSMEAWIEVPQAKLDEIGDWLQEAIRRAVDAKQGMDDKIVEWEQQYEAIPKTATKQWPWEGASNLIVPIIAIHVEAVLSRLMGSIFIGKNLWQGMPKSAKWVDLVEPMEQWLNWVGHDVMDMYEACQRWFLGMLKFGTGVAKVPWEKIVRKVKYKMPDGSVKIELVERYNGPKMYVVPLSDFYVTPDAYSTLDIQNCEGLFQRCVYTKKTLKEKEGSGIFINVDKVLASPRSEGTRMEDQKDSAMGINRANRDGEFETWECWVSYVIDDNGTVESGTDSTGKPITIQGGELSEVLIDYHYPTKTILRAVYNPYRHQERPFHFIRFCPREGSLWGLGICQMLQDIQTEISTEHNLRLDNATISNAPTFTVLRTSHLDEVEIYPGAFVPVDSQDDIKPLLMGATHDTLLREELNSFTIGEKRTGVNDYTSGRESQAIGSRATATSTLALIREGNKRFLMTINDIRKSLKNIAHQIIMLYQQFVPAGQDNIMYEIFSPDEAKWVEKYMTMPVEYTRANIAIDVPALSEVENKDAKKQGMLTLMQLMQTFYQAMFQAVSIATSQQAPPQIKALGTQAAIAGTEMWKRVLEAFEFRDPATFAPNIEDILMIQASMETGGGQVNGQTEGAGPTGAGNAPGLPQGGPGMGPGTPTPEAPGAGLPIPVPAGAGAGGPVQGYGVQ
jgi:hypothetical protein